MVRKRLITRSIKIVECECLCLDTGTGETFNTTVSISGNFKNPTEMLMLAKEQTETEDVIVCTILKTSEKVKRYWMEENVFLKYATEFSEEKVYNSPITAPEENEYEKENEECIK